MSSIKYWTPDYSGKFKTPKNKKTTLLRVVSSEPGRFIKRRVSEVYSGARNWKMSKRDSDNCDLILEYAEKVLVGEKLQAGLRSAVKKNEWSFNQIVYQAVAAINTYDEYY